MKNTFTRVCAVVCIILVQVSTAPTSNNNIPDLNIVIKEACQPNFNNITPLPESCSKPTQKPLDHLCYVIVGYVIDLCKLNKTEGITNDAAGICNMELPVPGFKLKETPDVLNSLKDPTVCNNKCKDDLPICSRLFNLASLLSPKPDIKLNETTKLETKIITNANTQPKAEINHVDENPQSKPLVPNNITPPEDHNSPSSLSQPADQQKPPAVSESTKNDNFENPNLPVGGNKPANSSVENKVNLPPIIINNVKDEKDKNLNADSPNVPLASGKLNGLIPPVNNIPKITNEPKPKQTDRGLGKQFSDQADNAGIEEQKTNDELPEDTLSDPARGDDEDADAHDGNFQPEDPPEEVGNNDDLSIREDEIKPSNLQPPQPKNEELNIPISESNGPFQESPDSHFFAYFLFFTCITIVAYIAFHNKNKILALALEGRRGRNGRRRPNTASYRKLDSSLEEAMTSHPSRASLTHVIY